MMRKKVCRSFKEAEKLYFETAKLIALKINSSIEKKDKCLLVLSGGSTPKKLFPEIISILKSKGTELRALKCFLSDERVSEDPSLLNQNMIKEEFLNQLDEEISFSFPINPHDEKASAKSYQQNIESLSEGLEFDLCLLGIGPDGHYAGLFDKYSSDKKEILVSGPGPEGALRITMSPAYFKNAENILIAVDKESKKDALNSIIHPDQDNKSMICSQLSELGKNLHLYYLED